MPCLITMCRKESILKVLYKTGAHRFAAWFFYQNILNMKYNQKSSNKTCEQDFERKSSQKGEIYIAHYTFIINVPWLSFYEAWQWNISKDDYMTIMVGGP